MFSCYTGKLLCGDPEASIWFENCGVVGPGLKTGVVGPKSSTDGGT